MHLALMRRVVTVACVGIAALSLGMAAMAQSASPAGGTSQPATTQTCPCPKPPVKKHRRVVRKKTAAKPAAAPVEPISSSPVIPEKPAPPPAPAVQIPSFPATEPPSVQPTPQSPIPPAPVAPAPLPMAEMPAPPPEPRSSRLLLKDGTPRINVEVGGGVQLPFNGAQNSQNVGGMVAAAVGYNFSRFFTLQARGEYDRAGVPSSVLVAQKQSDGRVELASGTVNMILRYAVVGRFGAYITGGGGYYRRVTKFMQSTASGTQNLSTVTAEYSMDTVGAAFGMGVEWRAWRRTGMKIFAEARYNYVEGQEQTGSASTYQWNSRTTEYAPALIGVRW